MTRKIYAQRPKNYYYGGQKKYVFKGKEEILSLCERQGSLGNLSKKERNIDNLLDLLELERINCKEYHKKR